MGDSQQNISSLGAASALFRTSVLPPPAHRVRYVLRPHIDMPEDYQHPSPARKQRTQTVNSDVRDEHRLSCAPPTYGFVRLKKLPCFILNVGALRCRLGGIDGLPGASHPENLPIQAQRVPVCQGHGRTRPWGCKMGRETAVIFRRLFFA